MTVDPERDTPELLKTYLESFDLQNVTLAGTPKGTATAAKTLRIFCRKVPAESGGCNMDLSSLVIVTDAEGELVSLIDYHEGEATALSKPKIALARSGGEIVVRRPPRRGRGGQDDQSRQRRRSCW